MAAEYYEANGIISGDAASPNTVSGTSGKDRLVSGNEDGSANTGFQRFYGGNGSDSFTLRAQDFADTNTTQVSKHIADFQGASVYSMDNNDFISFVGFSKAHEGSTMSLVLTKSYDADPGDAHMLYTYAIQAGGETVGTILVNSINGKMLGAGDYAFYG